jgi:hypothetical protein
VSKHNRHIRPLSSQGDLQSLVIESNNRMNDTAHFGPQLSSAGAPARNHIVSRNGRTVCETCVPAQCNNPRCSVSAQLPRGGKSGPRTLFAVNPQQRFVELPEKHTLALVCRMGCVGRIHALDQSNVRDRFARFRSQPALIKITLWNSFCDYRG